MSSPAADPSAGGSGVHGLRNGVQLITYPDSMGGSLGALDRFLAEFLPDCFSGIHILPFFPSSGDRGFAPITYRQVEPAFGTWDDIRSLASRYELMADLMVNHLSRRSDEFRSFLEHGDDSPYAEMFLTPEKVWPSGVVPRDDLAKIHLRKQGDPFSVFTAAGKPRKVWTTFMFSDEPEQIDLDLGSRTARRFLEESIAFLAGNGIRVIRLDAVGYVIKKPGTSCFFVEPEIYEVLAWLRAAADRHGVVLLPELHSRYEHQEALSARGCPVYDFALPFLVLDALSSGDGAPLGAWLSRAGKNRFTMLDCHDGIPVNPDLSDLLPAGRIAGVLELMERRGANFSRILDHNRADERPVHQVNITYYSALGEHDEAYLAARAIQLFAPGIPQVYYVGLFAGRNDRERLNTTGGGREINRGMYDFERMRAELDRPVVKRLLALIRFRNSFPAFGGRFRLLPSSAGELALEWTHGEYRAAAHINLAAQEFRIECREPGGAYRLPV